MCTRVLYQSFWTIIQHSLPRWKKLKDEQTKASLEIKANRTKNRRGRSEMKPSAEESIELYINHPFSAGRTQTSLSAPPHCLSAAINPPEVYLSRNSLYISSKYNQDLNGPRDTWNSTLVFEIAQGKEFSSSLLQIRKNPSNFGINI